MEIGYGGLQNVPQTAMVGSDNIHIPTVEERLLTRKKWLESQLVDVNNALEALQANPEVLKIMCLISKVNY